VCISHLAIRETCLLITFPLISSQHIWWSVQIKIPRYVICWDMNQIWQHGIPESLFLSAWQAVTQPPSSLILTIRNYAEAFGTALKQVADLPPSDLHCFALLWLLPAIHCSCCVAGCFLQISGYLGIIQLFVYKFKYLPSDMRCLQVKKISRLIWEVLHQTTIRQR
jgi:hypothetical protein